MLRATDSGNIPGYNGLRRTAETTARYAEAVRQVGKDRNVEVCDVWSSMMREAGWDAGKTGPLPGCEDAEENDVLRRFLSDGEIVLVVLQTDDSMTTADLLQAYISPRMATGSYTTNSWCSLRRRGRISSPRSCLWFCRPGTSWRLGRICDAYDICSSNRVAS